MIWLKTALVSLICTLMAFNAGIAQQPGAMVTTGDLLKDPKFKSAYLISLGPKANEKWLVTMTNSSLVQTISLAGDTFQVATPCKPHDCGENNLLLLYARAKGSV